MQPHHSQLFQNVRTPPCERRYVTIQSTLSLSQIHTPMLEYGGLEHEKKTKVTPLRSSGLFLGLLLFFVVVFFFFYKSLICSAFYFGNIFSHIMANPKARIWTPHWISTLLNKTWNISVVVLLCSVTTYMFFNDCPSCLHSLHALASCVCVQGVCVCVCVRALPQAVWYAQNARVLWLYLPLTDSVWLCQRASLWAQKCTWAMPLELQ